MPILTLTAIILLDKWLVDYLIAVLLNHSIQRLRVVQQYTKCKPFTGVTMQFS